MSGEREDDGFTATGRKPLPETPFGLTKVYMDYLPRSNDGLESRLERFLNCGKIIKLLKKSGKTNGYVVFKKPNSVRIALTRDNNEFEGKRVRIELPKGLVGEAGNTPAADAPAPSMSKKKWTPGEARTPEFQVYISHLAKPVNPEILRSVIGDETPALLQSVQHIKMMGERNCCFVTLSSEADVGTFCERFNKYPLLGQDLQVLPAVAPGRIKKEGGIPDEFRLENLQSRRSTVEVDDSAGADSQWKSGRWEESWNGGGGDDRAEAPKAERREVQETAADQARIDRENHERQVLLNQIGEARSVLAGVFGDEARQGDIKDTFKRCGRVIQVRMMRNKVTGTFTGVASVRFDKPESVRKALLLNDTESQYTSGNVCKTWSVSWVGVCFYTHTSTHAHSSPSSSTV